MHEMALVRTVVDMVVEKAEAAHVSEVRAVNLAIGAARDIVEDYFEGLFRYLARETVAEHAQVIIYRIPYTVRCNHCGLVFPLDIFDRATWKCPDCKVERDYTLNSGTEFCITSIEVAANPRERECA